MRGKLLFITGGLVGYVLGARAGRKRYEQITAAATDLWNAPPVQRRVTEVRDFALDKVGDTPVALFTAGKKIATVLTKKSQRTSKGTGTPAAAAATPGTPATTAAHTD